MRDGCPFCDYAGPSPIWRRAAASVVGLMDDLGRSIGRFVGCLYLTVAGLGLALAVVVALLIWRWSR